MNKRGMINISLMFLGILFILLITMTFMLYFQVGLITNEIKDELFYTLMNGQATLDKEELALTNYMIDRDKLEYILNKWVTEIAKNKINVEEIKIKELLTSTSNRKATIKVVMIVTFNPIVKISDKVAIVISDEIDLSLLKFE